MHWNFLIVLILNEYFVKQLLCCLSNIGSIFSLKHSIFQLWDGIRFYFKTSYHILKQFPDYYIHIGWYCWAVLWTSNSDWICQPLFINIGFFVHYDPYGQQDKPHGFIGTQKDYFIYIIQIIIYIKYLIYNIHTTVFCCHYMVFPNRFASSIYTYFSGLLFVALCFVVVITIKLLI